MRLSRKTRRNLLKVMNVLKSTPYIPRWVVFLIDILICVVAFIFTSLIYADINQGQFHLVKSVFLYTLPLNLFFYILFFILFRTYVGIVRHSTFVDAFRIILSVISAIVALFLVNRFYYDIYKEELFSVSVLIISGSLSILMMLSFRITVKLSYDYFKNNSSILGKRIPVLVYGISDDSIAIAQMISGSSGYTLQGFINRNGKINQKRLMDVPIYEEKEHYELIRSRKIRGVIMSLSDVPEKDKTELVDLCIENRVQVISVPPISQWQGGKPSLKQMKKVEIEDLLGRPPIKLDDSHLQSHLSGKRILITGAAGSIGSEIARQIADLKPEILVLCDTAETPLHNLNLEIKAKYPTVKYIVEICNIVNVPRMEAVFKKYKPQYVYHAAAYKHVPLMEMYPAEAILNNVQGTINIADLSCKYGVESFVMVSTDKAVNPTNVMGASKRIAEIYIQSLYKHIQSKYNTHTKFITTRFGNVLGSNGSVIPLFREQILKGGPVTVTHRDIIRYFMTIPEACRLVLEAGTMGEGGEIFIFDMGEPVKIYDLAKRMIKLAGFTPDEDIKIEFSGLRPGEKLYEELLNNKELTRQTHHEKIMIAKVREYDFIEVTMCIEDLIECASNNEPEDVVRKMKEIVPEFVSNNSEFSKLDKKELY